MKALLLAAGLGTRLRPLTYFVPKPLVSVGGKPIIDRVIAWLTANGINEIYVIGYYMQNLLRSYLEERHPNAIFVPSRRLLGTAGQLYYAKGYLDDGPVLVAPSDVLTDLDIREVIRFHEKASALLTVVGQEVETSLRFGVLDVEEGKLTAWREKPKFKHVVSTGIYLVEGRALQGLKEEYLDFNDFAQSLMPRVAVYVSKAKFYDVGTLEDLAKARQLGVINI